MKYLFSVLAIVLISQVSFSQCDTVLAEVTSDNPEVTWTVPDPFGCKKMRPFKVYVNNCTPTVGCYVEIRDLTDNYTVFSQGFSSSTQDCPYTYTVEQLAGHQYRMTSDFQLQQYTCDDPGVKYRATLNYNCY
jgi:hypothetical protein